MAKQTDKPSILSKAMAVWLGIGAACGVLLTLVSVATDTSLQSLIFRGQVHYEPINFDPAYDPGADEVGGQFLGEIGITNYKPRSINVLSVSFHDANRAIITAPNQTTPFICFFLDEKLVKRGDHKELQCRGGAITDPNSIFSPYSDMVQRTCYASFDIAGGADNGRLVSFSWVENANC